MLKKIVRYFEDDKKYSIFENGFEKLKIISDDYLNLYGFYKDNNCQRLAILVHGYGGNHEHMAKFAEYFERRGYDILAVDLRSHGISEGREITMGVRESEDIEKWINKMLEKKPNYKIVLFGVSMGASTICLTASKISTNKVVLAIEDSGFDNADKELRFMFLKHKILSKLNYKIFYNYTKKAEELDLKRADVAQKLKDAKIPILFIHGDCDQVVPTEMVYSLSNSLPPQRREVYIGKGAGHVGSYSENPTEYERVLNGFLSKFNM